MRAKNIIFVGGVHGVEFYSASNLITIAGDNGFTEKLTGNIDDNFLLRLLWVILVFCLNCFHFWLNSTHFCSRFCLFNT
jgi:hypothetical protein